MKIDLHSHSTHSDGSFSVKEILEKAEKEGIKGLCISDHDNLAGSLEAVELSGEIFSGEMVVGIEISTKVAGKTVHLLAYLPSPHVSNESELQINLEKIRTDRIRRMKVMIKKAHEGGFDITYDDVIKEASTGLKGDIQPIDVISRPHFARAFVSKGYASTTAEVFDKYIADGKPFHAPRFSLQFQEWIDIVHRMGGLISWAHPLHNHDNDLNSVKETAKFLVQNIDAIELYYRYDGKYPVTQELQNIGFDYLKGIIKENELLITAGGDFHGDVGVLGGVDLPETDWINFKRKLYDQTK